VVLGFALMRGQGSARSRHRTARVLTCPTNEETVPPLQSACQRHFLKAMPFPIGMETTAPAHEAPALE
jgi:hypothetical protein